MIFLAEALFMNEETRSPSKRGRRIAAVAAAAVVLLAALYLLFAFSGIP